MHPLTTWLRQKLPYKENRTSLWFVYIRKFFSQSLEVKHQDVCPKNNSSKLNVLTMKLLPGNLHMILEYFHKCSDILLKHSNKVIQDTFSSNLINLYETKCYFPRLDDRTFLRQRYKTSFPIDDPEKYTDQKSKDVFCWPSFELASYSTRKKLMTPASGTASLYYPSSLILNKKIFCKEIQKLSFSYTFETAKRIGFLFVFQKIVLLPQMGQVKVQEGKLRLHSYLISGLHSNFSHIASSQFISVNSSINPCLHFELTFIYQCYNGGIQRWNVYSESRSKEHLLYIYKVVGPFNFQFTHSFFLMETFLVQVPKINHIKMKKLGALFLYTARVFDGPDPWSEEIVSHSLYITSTFQCFVEMLHHSSEEDTGSFRRSIHFPKHGVGFESFETESVFEFIQDNKYPTELVLPSESCTRYFCLWSLQTTYPHKLNISIIHFDYVGSPHSSCTYGGLLGIEKSKYKYRETATFCQRTPKRDKKVITPIYSHTSQIKLLLYWYKHHCTIETTLSVDRITCLFFEIDHCSIISQEKMPGIDWVQIGETKNDFVMVFPTNPNQCIVVLVQTNNISFHCSFTMATQQVSESGLEMSYDIRAHLAELLHSPNMIPRKRDDFFSAQWLQGPSSICVRDMGTKSCFIYQQSTTANRDINSNIPQKLPVPTLTKHIGKVSPVSHMDFYVRLHAFFALETWMEIRIACHKPLIPDSHNIISAKSDHVDLMLEVILPFS